MKQTKKKLLYVLPTVKVHAGLQHKIEGQMDALKTQFQATLHPLNRYLGTHKWTWIFGLIWYQFSLPLYTMGTALVYCRYNPKLPFVTLFLGLLSILKPIIIELNSDYDQELTYLNRPIERWAHRLQITILSWLPVHLFVVHQRYAEALKTKGFRSVTHLLNGYNAPITTTESTIDTDVIETVQSFKRQHPECRIGIFVGSGPDWHGVDKLNFILETNPTVAIIRIGNYVTPPASERILSLPAQSIHTLQHIYPLCHFGIGSLNWSLIGITEGTPLKTCEYLFFGLPIFVNYHDWNSRFPVFQDGIFDMSCDIDAFDKLLLKPIEKIASPQKREAALSWETRLLPPIQAVLRGL